MVTAQLALSVVLLMGAMVVGKSFVQLLDVDLGVVRDRVLSVQLNLTMGRDLDATARIGLTERVIERVRALPAVEAVGAANGLPPNQSRMRFQFEDSAATFGPPRVHRLTFLNPTPGYFEALNFRLLRGRLFSERDTAESAQVMILGASAARRIFGTLDVVGQSLPTTREQKPTIVGVVNDVKYSDLASPAEEVAYQPFAQFPHHHMNLVVRTSGDPLALAGAIRHAVHEIDRGITIVLTNSLDALVSDSLSAPRLRAALLLTLAVLSLGLASVGLGGAVAYSVAQRTREIAIRMALGARGAHVRVLVMREACGLALTGLTVGLLGAWVTTRSLESFLYEVAPTDGQSFLMTGLCLGLVTLVASYLPARRAAATDPMVALRAE